MRPLYHLTLTHALQESYKMVRLTMCREANEVYEETSLVHQSSICRQMELPYLGGAHPHYGVVHITNWCRTRARGGVSCAQQFHRKDGVECDQFSDVSQFTVGAAREFS